MKITTVGIDLAKNVFQVHGVDERGQVVLRKQLRRAQVAVFFGNLPPCLIGMEACASAHYWGRTLQRFGHTVRLMASQFVKPYVKTNKNDVADAEAICEAVGRANMRFVPIKSIEQQAILSVHRVRQGFVKARTAQANQIRGLLGEFGLVGKPQYVRSTLECEKAIGSQPAHPIRDSGASAAKVRMYECNLILPALMN
jgi:transposase